MSLRDAILSTPQSATRGSSPRGDRPPGAAGRAGEHQSPLLGPSLGDLGLEVAAGSGPTSKSPRSPTLPAGPLSCGILQHLSATSAGRHRVNAARAHGERLLTEIVETQICRQGARQVYIGKGRWLVASREGPEIDLHRKHDGAAAVSNAAPTASAPAVMPGSGFWPSSQCACPLLRSRPPAVPPCAGEPNFGRL